MDYRQRVRQEAQLAGLDPNIAEAVLMRESAGNPNAVSLAGAQGLMQLMPGTAKELGVDPRDPVQNIQGGVKYLKKQIDQYGVPAGIAAYNAGPGRVAQAGGNFNALPAETRAYVPAVMNTAANLAQGGGRVNQEPNIGQIMSALEKAKAANDTDAVNEISGLLTNKFTAAKQKAQAAGDTAAVAEIEAQMGNLVGKPLTVPPVGKVESAPLPDITPKGSPTAVPQATAAPKPEEKSLFRTVDDAVRGIADTVTFGYADELAAKADQAINNNKTLSGIDKWLKDKTGGFIGLSQSNGQTYEQAVKDQRQRDSEGGGARLAGQVAGALVPGAGVVGAVRAPANATRLGRAGAGAATGAIQGGLYGSGAAEEGKRLEGAGEGALLGGAVGGVLGGVLPATVSQVASDIKKKAGNEAAAAMDAEIIQDLSKIAKSEANRGEPVMAIHANALEQKYVSQANRALKDLGKDGLSKMGVVVDDVKDAIQARRVLTTDELNALRTNPAGEALASAIEKAQRTRSLTAQQSANPSLLAKGIRLGIEAAPTAIGGSVGGIPGAVVGAMGTKAASNWAQRLTGKASREQVIQNLIKDKNVAAAKQLTEELGPSAATQSLEKLQGVAQKAQTAQAAKTEAMKALKQQAVDAGEQLRIRNLQMGIRSNPKFVQGDIGGGTRGTLQYYGRLADSKELAKGLKIIEKTDPYLAPYIASIKQNKSVPNKDILLGLSDRLLKLRDDGILKPYIK